MKIGVDEEQDALINEVSKRLNDNTRRIRVLEERLRNLDTQVNTSEQAVLFDKNQTVKDVQSFQDELKLIRDRIANLEVDIQTIHREMKKSVAHTELKEIQNYIDLVSPILTKFVTRKELEEMLEERRAIDESRQ